MLEKMKLPPLVIKRILAGCGAVVLSFLWLGFYVAPQRKVSADLNQRVKTLRQDLIQTRERITQLPDMEQELRRLLSQHEAAVVPAAPEEQLPEMLDSIAQMAKGFQVRLVSVKPKADLNQLTPGVSGYLELPVEILASAGYHQLGSFLDALEDSENLVRVSEFKVQADPGDPWHHQVNLVLQVYLFPGGERSKKS